MLQIGICDDAPEARLGLHSALERVLEKRGTEYQVFEFSSGEGLLGWLLKHRGELDLVFLDIEMSGLDGMETARRLRAQDAGLQIVFVTGYSDYVYDGYSVGALGYILKPAKAPQLEDVITRALAALLSGREESFFCHCGESAYRVLRRDILYFVSDRRQVLCVTAARTYAFYGRLDEVERELDDRRFVRIHQRYLVFAPAVERIDATELTIGELTLPISRSCRSEALLALTRAMLK